MNEEDYTALPVRPLTLRAIAQLIHQNHPSLIAAYVEGAGYSYPLWALAFPNGAVLVAVDEAGKPVKLDEQTPGEENGTAEGRHTGVIESGARTE